MAKSKQPKNPIGKEQAENSRDDLGLPALTPEEEAYEKACDAIIDARMITKFGPKREFTDEEYEAALDELDAEGAFPAPP